MSSSLQGLNQSEDLYTTTNHSGPTLPSIKVDNNTSNMPIKCYKPNIINNRNPRQRKLSELLTQSSSSPPAAVEPLVQHTHPQIQKSPSTTSARQYSLNAFLLKSNITPITSNTPSQPGPPSTQPATIIPPPHQPTHRPLYRGPNPYLKPTPNRHVLRAIAQLQPPTGTNSLHEQSTHSSIDSIAPSDNRTQHISIRTRTIRAPVRFGFPSPTPTSPHDSSSTTSSLCSPMAASDLIPTQHSVDLSSIILKELEEISQMTATFFRSS